MDKHRLAFATSDKLTVYQHFGNARGFEIVDIENDTYEFVEYRKVTPPCDGGAHSESAFDAVLEALTDCEAIVVGKIGPGAAEYLASKGIRVFEAPGVVENIVATIVKKKLLPEKSAEKEI
jgi:predicted Fe-Mo cluster-binding NifX family protein